MIGNDVVDLELAGRQSNWRRKGFLEKILAHDEIRFVLEHDDPEKALWSSWAMKESAYKIVNRSTGLRKFNPSRFVCDPSARFVEYESVRYAIRLKATPDFIYAEATSRPDFTGWKTLFTKEPLRIPGLCREGGVPYIVEAGAAFPVSITHHGRYYAAVSQFQAEPRFEFEEQ